MLDRVLRFVITGLGVIAGLLGVGGGIVLVPAFFYTFSHLGYDGPQLMQVCLGTSLATIMATAMRSVRAHDRKGAVDWDLLKGWAPPIAIGAVAGFILGFQSWNGLYLWTIAGAPVPWLPRHLGYGGALIVSLAVLAALAWFLLRRGVLPAQQTPSRDPLAIRSIAPCSANGAP